MTHPTIKACFYTCTLIAAIAMQAHAQPDTKPDTQSNLDRANILKGPTVSIETQHTLGSTTMSGHFTPVEGRPELAAFSLITNDPNHLAAARELDNKRTFDLATYLVDEIDTVREITDAITSGDAPTAKLLLAQLRQRFEPTLPRNPLAPELETMLTNEQRVEFHRILDDYWLRLAASHSKTMSLAPDSDEYKTIENRLNHELFEQDIQLAYESSLKRYRDTTDAIYTAVQPTDDQQAQIRNLIIEHIKDTRLKATIEQRQALMLKIYTLLDDDRRELLFLFMTRAAIGRTG